MRCFWWPCSSGGGDGHTAATTAATLSSTSTSAVTASIKTLAFGVETHNGLIALNNDNGVWLFGGTVFAGQHAFPTTFSVKDATGRIVGVGHLDVGAVLSPAPDYVCRTYVSLVVPRKETDFVTVAIAGRDYPMDTRDISEPVIDVENE